MDGVGCRPGPVLAGSELVNFRLDFFQCAAQLGLLFDPAEHLKAAILEFAQPLVSIGAAALHGKSA